jgi:hypothetical protein
MSVQGTVSTKGTLEGDTSAVGEIKGKVSTPTVIYTDAYTIAVKNGFEGTVEEWLASLKGEKGDMPPIDDAMSATSENPVQNKVITEAFGNIDNRLQAVERNSGGGEAKAAHIAYIDLLSAKWQGGDNLYSQVVDIAGVTEYSKVDINPSVEQLAIFYKKDIAFTTENEDGVVTVYCIGQKPADDYTMQVTITEVNVNG